MDFDHGVSSLAFKVGGIGFVTPPLQYEVVQVSSTVPLGIQLIYACNDFVVENPGDGTVRFKGRPGQPLQAASGLISIYPLNPADKIDTLVFEHIGIP
ncbi:MAG: hypothetical protein CM15mV19_1450 [uncultured marine virus]|nr:MAG: hypothetical protein CM15mV19_1450 [uncultured marine virus]